MNWLGRNLSNLNFLGRYFFSNEKVTCGYQEDGVVPKDIPCAPQTPYVGLCMVIFWILGSTSSWAPALFHSIAHFFIMKITKSFSNASFGGMSRDEQMGNGLPSLKLTARTWKCMLGIQVSFSNWLLSGATGMLVAGSVTTTGSRWWFHTFFIFIPNPGEMIQFDKHMFQMGWFNHQLGSICPIQTTHQQINESHQVILVT